MRLQTYLDLTGQAVQPFANRVGVTGAAVYRWLDGTRRPNPEQMRQVFRATHGAVTPNDWVLGQPAYEREVAL